MNIIEHNWAWAHALSNRSATDAIVIHHAAADTASPEAVHAWHLKNGWAGIGYHLYVRKDGSIHRGRPHAASGAQVLNHNYHTAGICCEGNYDVPGAVMPRAQMEALHEAIRYMKRLYPKAAVKFHRDFGGTVCPGRYFPAQEALNYDAGGASPAPTDPAGSANEHVGEGLAPPAPWYIANGEWAEAKRLGITDGTEPERSITRAEAAAMALRACKAAKGAKA